MENNENLEKEEIIEEENNLIIEPYTHYKEPLGKVIIEYLPYMILATMGFIAILVGIMKKMDLGFAEMIAGVTVGSLQLKEYYKEEKKLDLICAILWFIIGVMGIISFILH